MNSITKINSIQGGVLTSTQNLVDFQIPEGMKLDMSKSYININTEINSGDPAGKIHLLNLVKNGMGNNYNHGNAPAITLVKNASLNFDNVGMVEDIRDVNILKCNSRNYEMDVDQLRSEDFKGLNGRKDECGLFGSPYVDFIKEGDTASKYKQHDIRIPLSEIFGLGESVVDTGRVGSGNLHLELDLNNLALYERQGSDAGAGVGYWTDTDIRSQVDPANLSSNGSVGTRSNATTGEVSVADATNAGGALLTMTRLYDSLEESPFFNGMEVSVSGTNMTDADFTVVNISYTPATKKIQLTLDAIITLTNNANPATGVSLTGKNSAGGGSVSFNSAQLVAYEDTSGTPAPDKIEYKTFTSEVDSSSPMTSYSRLYFVEPECSNVLIMTPLAGSSILSDLDVVNYRIRVNGVETTNRPVPAQHPLHYDRISRVLLNQDKTLKNVQERVFDVNAFGIAGSHLSAMIGETVPLTNSQKQFEVEINSTAGLTKIYLYKEVQREL